MVGYFVEIPVIGLLLDQQSGYRKYYGKVGHEHKVKRLSLTRQSFVPGS